jgi:hypothetical protein
MHTVIAPLRRFLQTSQTALSALALAASVLAAPARAGACVAPQSGPFFEVRTQHVPTNGVLVVGYYCYTDCETAEFPTELTIVDDADGTTVPGSVIKPPVDVSLPDLILWRPDDGFQEDHFYHVESEQDLVFWAVPAMTVDPSVLTPASDCALEDRSFGEEICCPGICDSHPCVSAAVRRVPACHVNWWEGQDIAGAQYLGRLTWSTAEEPETTDEWQWGGYKAHDFSAQAEQYCYELEVVSLIDGSSRLLPESCLPHGSLGQVGVFAKSRADFTNEVTNQCGAPRAEVGDVWCAGVDTACTEGDQNACATRTSECAAGAGQGGQGSAGQSNATAGQGAGGQNTGGQPAAGQGQGPTPAAGAGSYDDLDFSQDSGCSCSVPGGAGGCLGGSAIALVTLGGMWARRRRRGAHARPIPRPLTARSSRTAAPASARCGRPGSP